MRPSSGVMQSAIRIISILTLGFLLLPPATVRAGLNDPNHVFIANEPRLQLGPVTAERLGSIFDAGAGPFASARAGDWRLSNEHVSVTFADVSPTSAGAENISMPTIGYRPQTPGQSYPGGILDVAVDGNYLDFVIAFTQFAGLDPEGNQILYDTVQPVKREDKAGLQFEGSPFENSPVRVRTTYWLAPGAYFLEVESEVRDLPPGEPAPVLGDLGLWGYGIPLVDRGGEIYNTQNAKQPLEGDFYQFQGAEMVMGVSAPEGVRLQGFAQGPPFTLNTHFIPAPKADARTTRTQAGATTATLALAAAATTATAEIAKPIAGTIKRDLWLTRGTLGEQLEKIQESRHVQTGRIMGSVLEADGQTSVPNATVLVRWSDFYEYEKKAPVIYTRLQTDAQGRYSIRVPGNGFFSIIPEPRSKVFMPGSMFLQGFLPQPGRTNRVNAVMSPESGVRVSVVDAQTSRPLAARLRLEAIPPNAPINFGFPLSARQGYLEYRYIPPDGDVVYLPPGRWTVHAGHGISYELGDMTLTVEPGKIQDVKLALKKSSPTPGWTHLEVGVHTKATPGCMIEPGDMALMCAAEGIEWVVTGDYEKLTDLGPVINELGLSEILGSSRGFRTSLPAHPEWGQFLVYPVAADAPDPAQARAEWAGLKTAKEFIETLRRLYPGALIQSDLPYTENGLGYFAIKNRAPSQFSWNLRPDIDPAIDAVGILPVRVSWDFRTLRTFWMYNLARGRNYIPASSCSAGTVYGAEPGYPRLLAFLGPEAKPAEAAILEALKARRVQITSGPFIDFSIKGSMPGGLVDPDPQNRIHLKVTAPRWIDTSLLAFNKETASRFSMMITASSDEVQRFPRPDRDEELASMPLNDIYLNEQRDTLLAVEVYSTSPYKDVLPATSPGEEVLPMALIMPIAVDMNKNGKFDPLEFFIQLGT